MIRPEFQVHKLNAEGLMQAADIAHEFTVFLNTLEAYIGTTSREAAIVRTKLEEACFFAKKAMASKPENQQ